MDRQDYLEWVVLGATYEMREHNHNQQITNDLPLARQTLTDAGFSSDRIDAILVKTPNLPRLHAPLDKVKSQLEDQLTPLGFTPEEIQGALNNADLAP